MCLVLRYDLAQIEQLTVVAARHERTAIRTHRRATWARGVLIVLALCAAALVLAEPAFLVTAALFIPVYAAYTRGSFERGLRAQVRREVVRDGWVLPAVVWYEADEEALRGGMGTFAWSTPWKDVPRLRYDDRTLLIEVRHLHPVCVHHPAASPDDLMAFVLRAGPRIRQAGGVVEEMTSP